MESLLNPLDSITHRLFEMEDWGGNRKSFLCHVVHVYHLPVHCFYSLTSLHYGALIRYSQSESWPILNGVSSVMWPLICQRHYESHCFHYQLHSLHRVLATQLSVSQPLQWPVYSAWKWSQSQRSKSWNLIGTRYKYPAGQVEQNFCASVDPTVSTLYL